MTDDLSAQAAALLALSERATESPWFMHDFADPRVSSDPTSPANIYVSCTTPDHITVASMGGALTGELAEARANAVFIAAARTTAPALAAAYLAMQWRPIDECERIGPHILAWNGRRTIGFWSMTHKKWVVNDGPQWLGQPTHGISLSALPVHFPPTGGDHG